MVRVASTSDKMLVGYSHLAFENALMETEDTFDFQCLEGGREHNASLANMTLTDEGSCHQHTEEMLCYDRQSISSPSFICHMQVNTDSTV